MTRHEQALVEAHERVRQAQEILDSYRLWEHQLIFGIAYGAAAEAWDALEELRTRIADQETELARLQADLARLQNEDSA